MAPRLYLIRHAEALHNADERLRTMLDPPLSATGQDQARQLGIDFPIDVKSLKIFSSPLRRALQTSLTAFGPLLRPGSKIVSLPDAQETSDIACDTGSDLQILLSEFADCPIDLSRVPDGWDSKTGTWDPHDEPVNARARRLRAYLAAQHQDMILVTHGWFIHYLTEDWSEIAHVGYGSGFKNCEYRMYEFCDSADGIKIQRVEKIKEISN